MLDKRTILLVEDNEELNEINRRALEKQGCVVLKANTLCEARKHLSRLDPDVILLDVLLPDGNGFDFCMEIRDTIRAYIIFLTSRREYEDKLHGMMLGGDNYLTKPFKLEELLVHVAAAIRRLEIDAKPIQIIQKGNLILDILAATAFVGGVDLLMTPKEFALLSIFVRNENKILSAEYLYSQVWKKPLIDERRSLKKHISEVRNKLLELGSQYTIVAVYGKGYCFEKNA